MIYLILLIGISFRLISLDQSLWLDEATSALVAKMSLTDIFTKFLPGDFHPPLYYLLLKLWTSAFGFSEISLRLPSVLFGIGTIYITYLIAKKLFDKQTGLISAILVATSGLSIYYSQEARMYSLAAFLVALLIYLFSEKKWILFSIILALLAMADYVSLLILPVFWLAGLKDWKKLAMAHVPMLAVFTFWFPIFYKQLGVGLSLKGSNWWNLLGTATFKNAALIPIKFILGRISFDNKIFYTAIAMFVSIIFIYLLYRVRKGSRLIWYWLTLPIVLGILISFKIPTLSYFRFIFCLPALYILVAFGIEKYGKYKTILFASILIINILSSGYYLFSPKFWREDWRLAAKAIGQDEIVFPSNSQKEALIYYGKGSQIVDIGNFKGVQQEIWLSRYVWQVFDSSDFARKKVEGLGYNKVVELSLNGVVLDKYARSN